jgi:hypothetical protein
MATEAISNNASALLSLPVELRDRIYDFLLPDDIELFAETAQVPPLLSVCHQTQNDYAPIFYGTTSIQVDAYYQDTDTWCDLRDAKAKRRVLEASTFADLSEFWSLASARRHCRHTSYGRGDMPRGIVTVLTNGGFRGWQWTCVRA